MGTVKVDLDEELEKLGRQLVLSDRFLPPNVRDELGKIRRALVAGVGEQQAKLDALQDGDFFPAGGTRIGLFEGDALDAAKALAGWGARGGSREGRPRARCYPGGTCFRPPDDLLRVAA